MSFQARSLLFWGPSETREQYKVILWPGSMGLHESAQDVKCTVGPVDIWASKRHEGNHGRHSLSVRAEFAVTSSNVFRRH